MRLNEIEGFDLENLIMAKFTHTKWVQSFLEGNIYMNNYNYFIEQEKRTKEKGQGDSFEGALVTESQNIKIYDNNGNLIATSKSGTLVERYEDVKKVPLFCISMFGAKDFKVIDMSEDSIRFQLDIPKEEKEKIKTVFSADKVVLTFSPGVFINRIKNTLLPQDPHFLCGAVDYVDYSIMDIKRRGNFDDMKPDFLFTKHHSLSYQREYRFVLPDIKSDRPYIINVGNLTDLFNVLTIDQFLDETYVQMNFGK